MMTRRGLVVAYFGLAFALPWAGGCAGGRARNTLPACEDGIDNDGDGLIDFPADPGCSSPTDPDEADKPPPLPQCSNGIDDDGDGLIDYGRDPGCSSPQDPDEWDKPKYAVECSDGIDNDGDGLIDYPNDPGCVDADHDDDERDPPVEPQCHDGIDNDGDGLIDYPNDPKCHSAAWESEFGAVVGPCGPDDAVTNITATGIATGDFTSAGPNDLTGSCGGNGQEVVFSFTLGKTSDLEATTDFPDTTVASVLYIRGTCLDPATEAACSLNPNPGGTGTSVVAHSLPPGTYYIVVDTFSPASLGHYHLQVSQRLALGAPCAPTSATLLCSDGAFCNPDPPTTSPRWKYDCRTGSDPSSPANCCTPPECSDLIDNDGDGWIDYPSDPGCKTPKGNSEIDACGSPTCAPSAEPQCANDVDDDGDGLIDYWTGLNLDHSTKSVGMDPDCIAASWPSEAAVCTSAATGATVNAITLSPSTPNVKGTATGGSSNFTGSCGTSTNSSPESVYVFYVTQPYASLTFTTDNAYTHSFDGSFFGGANDTVLYVEENTCSDTATQIACNDNVSTTDLASTVIVTSPPVGTALYVFVDSNNFGSFSYELDVSGTLADGSTCSASAPAFTCPVGDACKAPSGGGATVCAKAQCSDGVDNDGDGWIDYPNDPGCLSPSTDSELDVCGSPTCAPSVEPQCANDIDDDGDGLIDYWKGQNLDHTTKTVGADPKCLAASWPSEFAQCGAGITVAGLKPPGLFDATSAGAGHFASSGCGPAIDAATNGAPDNVYGLYVQTKLDTLTISTDTSFTDHDTVLYVRSGGMCSDATTEIACNDDRATWDTRSSLTLSSVMPGAYYVFVDGKTSAMPDFGNYQIVLQGVVPPGGTCDPASTAIVCRTGFTCKAATSGAAPTCVLAQCNDKIDNDGDGWIDYPNDPGCLSPSTDSELDKCGSPTCAPSAEPQCANDIDDDGDGLIDYWTGFNLDHSAKSVGSDPDCASASGDSESPECIAGEPLTEITAGTMSGNTAAAGLVNDFAPSCNLGSSSPEQVFHIHIPGTTSSLGFTAKSTGTYDPDLYVRYTSCGGSFDIACATGSSTTPATVSLMSRMSGDYYVFVDSNTSQTGTFSLTTTGILMPSQPCDPMQSGGTPPFIPCSGGQSCKPCATMGCTSTGYQCQ